MIMRHCWHNYLILCLLLLSNITYPGAAEAKIVPSLCKINHPSDVQVVWECRLLAPASNGPTCRRNMDPFSRFLNDSIISEKGTHPLVQ
jgi:hypothetical protein